MCVCVGMKRRLSDPHVCGVSERACIHMEETCDNYAAIKTAVREGNLERVEALVNKEVLCRFYLGTDDRCQYALVASCVLQSLAVSKWALSQPGAHMNGYVWYGDLRITALDACLRLSNPKVRSFPMGGGVDCTWLEMLAWVIQQEGVEVDLGKWVTLINGVFWDQSSDEFTRVEKIALLSHEPPMLTTFCPPSWQEKRIIAATKREMFNEWRKSMLEQLRGSVVPRFLGVLGL